MNVNIVQNSISGIHGLAGGYAKNTLGLLSTHGLTQDYEGLGVMSLLQICK